MQNYAALRIARPTPVRCFQDGQRNGSSVRGPPVKRVAVKFEVQQQTRFGESIGLVSSATGWDPKLPLKLEWSEGSVWRGEAELPAGEVVEYKYVLLSEQHGTVTWQPGSNLVLRLEDGARVLRVRDGWAGGAHEVQPLELLVEVPPAVAEPKPEPQPTPKHGPEAVPAAAVAAPPGPAVQHAAAEPAVPAQARAPVPAAAAVPAARPWAVPSAEQSWQQLLEVGSQPYVPPAPAAVTVAEAAEVAEKQEEQERGLTEAAESGSYSSDGNGNGNGEHELPAFAAAEEEPEQAAVGPSAEAQPAESAPAESAPAESAESAAEASCREVLAVANQPYVPPQQVQQADVVPAVDELAAAATLGSAEPAAPGAGEEEAQPVLAPSAAAAAPHQAAPAAALATAEPDTNAAALVPAVPAALPAASSSSLHRALRALLPFLRLLLAAAVILSALAAFLRSPWAAARWAGVAL